MDGVVGVVGVEASSRRPAPPLPSCPGQGSEAVGVLGVLSAVNIPCGSMLLDAVGTLDPDELLAPVGLEPLDAIATVAQSAAAATTATTAHQTLMLRRLALPCSWASPFCRGHGSRLNQARERAEPARRSTAPAPVRTAVTSCCSTCVPTCEPMRL